MAVTLSALKDLIVKNHISDGCWIYKGEQKKGLPKVFDVYSSASSRYEFHAHPPLVEEDENASCSQVEIIYLGKIGTCSASLTESEVIKRIAQRNHVGVWGTNGFSEIIKYDSGLQHIFNKVKKAAEELEQAVTSEADRIMEILPDRKE